MRVRFLMIIVLFIRAIDPPGPSHSGRPCPATAAQGDSFGPVRSYAICRVASGFAQHGLATRRVHPLRCAPAYALRSGLAPGAVRFRLGVRSILAESPFVRAALVLTSLRHPSGAPRCARRARPLPLPTCPRLLHARSCAMPWLRHCHAALSPPFFLAALRPPRRGGPPGRLRRPAPNP